jgi:hypothetical protein
MFPSTMGEIEEMIMEQVVDSELFTTGNTGRTRHIDGTTSYLDNYDGEIA